MSYNNVNYGLVDATAMKSTRSAINASGEFHDGLALHTNLYGMNFFKGWSRAADAYRHRRARSASRQVGRCRRVQRDARPVMRFGVTPRISTTPAGAISPRTASSSYPSNTTRHILSCGLARVFRQGAGVRLYQPQGRRGRSLASIRKPKISRLYGESETVRPGDDDRRQGADRRRA